MFLSAWIGLSVELHLDFVSKKISHKSDFDLGVRIDMIKCNPERISVTDIRTLPTAQRISLIFIIVINIPDYCPLKAVVLVGLLFVVNALKIIIWQWGYFMVSKNKFKTFF